MPRFSKIKFGAGLTATDEGDDVVRVDAAAAAVVANTLNVIIDGGGAAITTGVKGDVFLASAYTITAWTILADQTGDAVIDIWKDAYANYPPDVADSITASAQPTLTSAEAAQSSTLTGWTTAISAGDTLRFNVDSASTVTRLVLALTLEPA